MKQRRALIYAPFLPPSLTISFPYKFPNSNKILSPLSSSNFLSSRHRLQNPNPIQFIVVICLHTMSAIVCGKRSFFEELSTSPASSASPPVAKKLRCSSTSPVRLSNSPPLIDQLLSLFPNMDKQLLEKALEESGNDLDSAIKSLNELCLRYVDGNSGTSGKYVTVENSSSHTSIPRNGAEWVELFVTEMMNATSVDNARSRAMSMLESLEKSINQRSVGEAAKSLHKENTVLKEQIEALLRENTILKRAVAIQHERQKDYDESIQEVQHLKQLLLVHQEQMRTLQVNNYALTMHLKQAQESNSIPGRFHPDVF